MRFKNFRHQYTTMFRTPRYLEKTEYTRFNLDTPLEFPGNGQHQKKTAISSLRETGTMSTTGTTR